MMPCHGSDSGREQSRHDLRGLWMFHEHLDGVEKRFSFFFFFSTGARTGKVCRGKRFSHVNIAETVRCSNKIHAEL